MTNVPAPSGSPLLIKEEAANHLRISVSTLEKLMLAGEIEYFRVKGSIRFNQEQIDNYLARAARRA